MTRIRAGELRHRLALKRKKRARGAQGGWTESWSTVATVWGSMSPLSGIELIEAKKQGWEATHMAKIRYYAGLNPKYRITFDSRDFEIVSVQNLDERKIVLEVMCKEAG